MFVFFHYFKHIAPLSSHFHCCWWVICCNFYLLSSLHNVCPPELIIFFSLSLVLSNLIMICLGVTFYNEVMMVPPASNCLLGAISPWWEGGSDKKAWGQAVFLPKQKSILSTDDSWSLGCWLSANIVLIVHRLIVKIKLVNTCCVFKRSSYLIPQNLFSVWNRYYFEWQIIHFALIL